MNFRAIFAFLLVITIGCSKNTENINSLEWIIGDETELEITKTVNTQGNSSLQFKTEAPDFCLTHGVHVIIKEGENELLNEEVESQPSLFDVNIPINSNIEITTTIFPRNPQPFILCKRLGEVKCMG